MGDSSKWLCFSPYYAALELPPVGVHHIPTANTRTTRELPRPHIPRCRRERAAAVPNPVFPFAIIVGTVNISPAPLTMWLASPPFALIGATVSKPSAAWQESDGSPITPHLPTTPHMFQCWSEALHAARIEGRQVCTDTFAALAQEGSSDNIFT